jgi:hypothetical protein
MRPSLLLALAPLVYAGALFAQAPAIPAGQAHFNIVTANDGKTVGSADSNVSIAHGGYQITSHGDLKMAKFTYSFTNESRLDNTLNIVHNKLTGTVNGAQVTFTMGSDPTGRQFQINIDAAGKPTTNSVDRHQHTVLLPDLDPAAYSEAVHFAIEHPATTWVVIPKQTGLLLPSLYTPLADVHGTFHGQPVDAQHTSVVVSEQNGITVELYYTSEGALLEADLPEQNFYVIRDDFKLQSRPKYIPPHGTAPPANPNQPQDPNQAPGQQPPQYSVPQGGAPPQPQPQALLQSY